MALSLSACARLPAPFSLSMASVPLEHRTAPSLPLVSGIQGSLALNVPTSSISLRITKSLKAVKSGGRVRGLRTPCSAVWLDNRAQVEVDVPLPEAWKLWEDRELITNWMPWISSVKILKEQPELSRWTLEWNAFGETYQFSWTAKSLQPVFHQKIHWRAVDGLPNRGAVRFYPRNAYSCGIELTISYEVPSVLAPFASALSPIVEGIIQNDLERFSNYAKKAIPQAKA